ncbi:MAG TPA: FtsQ-type POTRA domain-containing protein [Anaerolineae bacterium]|nr:FtsQ-type POTRA domain-containing protein [Anaerolineae bacterium]
MKSRSQARPSRRYRRYNTTATLAGRLDARPRPMPHFAPQVNFDWLADLSKPRVLMAGALMLLVAAAAWLGLDGRFYVTKLSVTGATRTPPLEVANTSGLVGTHIFWVNAAEAEAQLLRSTPALKSARVTCQLPANCSIQVVERTPLIAWQYGQAVTWVDADGATFNARAAQPDLKLITIDAVQGPALIAGRPADPKVIAAALSVARALPAVKRYRFSGAHGLEFDDERGFPVYLGLADDMSDRVMIWKSLRDSLIAREIQPKFVDIRYPLAPFYGE